MLKWFRDELSLTTHRNIVFFALAFGVGILLFCVIFQATGGTLSAIKERWCATNDVQTRAERLVNVEALPVQSGTMTKRVTAVGRTKASEYVVIKAEINARLKEVLFTEGGNVAKGDDIIHFENNDVQAELQEAEANLVLTQSNFDRASKLHEQKVGSTKDYDKAKGEFDAATARVAVLKAKIEKTVIKAPFSGHIGIIKEDVNVGGFIQAGTELVTLVQTHPMKIDFKIPEKFVHDVGVGQSAEIRIDAFKDRVFLATVEAVDSKVDPDSHSLALRATTDNENNELLTGLFASVSLIVGERGNTVMVDESAIVREGTIETVWVIEKGKARQKAVKTGVREKNMVEIVAGVAEGEIVITTGQTRLQNGIKVKVVNDKDEIERERLAKEKEEERAEERADAEASASKEEPVKVEASKENKVNENKVDNNKDAAKIGVSQEDDVKIELKPDSVKPAKLLKDPVKTPLSAKEHAKFVQEPEQSDAIKSTKAETITAPIVSTVDKIKTEVNPEPKK